MAPLYPNRTPTPRHTTPAGESGRAGAGGQAKQRGASGGGDKVPNDYKMGLVLLGMVFDKIYLVGEVKISSYRWSKSFGDEGPSLDFRESEVFTRTAP